ncbi:MAG: hypothetical protein LAT53_05515 [Idiomarina sp.]|nr:hypothetical protein [Idiomarina sp.]
MLAKKLSILGGGIVLIGLIYYTSGYFNNADSSAVRSDVATQNQQSNALASGPDVVSDRSISTDKQSSSGSVLSSHEESADADSKELSESDDFLASDAFASPENLNRAFVDANGVVNSRSLNHVFQQEDLNQIVNRIRDSGHDEVSMEREGLLYQQLADALGAKVLQSNHACSGNICAVTIQSIDEISTDELSEFARFDTNYSFTNTQVNDVGEVTVFGIYIATDDPSRLSLSR